jgi:hypothetical protein
MTNLPTCRTSGPQTTGQMAPTTKQTTGRCPSSALTPVLRPLQAAGPTRGLAANPLARRAQILKLNSGGETSRYAPLRDACVLVTAGPPRPDPEAV